MSQLYNLTVQNLLAPVANITSLSGGTAYFTNINSSGTTSALNAANANVGSVTAQQANIQALQAQTASFNTVTTAIGNTQNLTIGTGNVSILNAQQANIQSLVGQSASFTTITSTGNSGSLTAAVGNLTAINAQQANIQSLVGQSASFTTITSTGNSGSLTAAVGNLATINSQQANIVVLNAQTSNLGNVVGPLNVLGDIVLTGNLRQTLFANTPGGGYPNYVFGNLAASNISASTFFTVPTANIGTLTVGNLVGYTASGGGGAQPNLYSISGNTLNYTYGNLGALTCGVAVHSGNLMMQGNASIAAGNVSANTVQLSGNINAAAASIGGPLTVVGNVLTNGYTQIPANNQGDWTYSNYTPSAGVVDRYGIGQYNNGRMRMFTSSYIPQSVVALSLSSSDTQGGAGTFTDLLTASNTSVLVNRPLQAGNVSANSVSTNTAIISGAFTAGPSVVNGSMQVNGGNGNGVQLYGSYGTYFTATGGYGNCGVQMQSYPGRSAGPTVAVVNVDDSNYSGHMCFHTANPGSASNVLSEKMRLTSGGNFGINQSNPLYLLDVGGAARISGNISANNVVAAAASVSGPLVANNIATPGNLAVYGSQLLVQSGNATPLQMVQTSGGGAGSSTGIGFQTYPGRAAGSQCQITAVDDGTYSGHIVFASANPGSASNLPVERMRLATSGNVGINQTAPQFLFHAQPTGTDTPAINPDATNSVMVYEDCKGPNLLSGTLSGNGAAYSQSSGYIQLTPQQNSTDGCINYNINPGTAFDVTAETYVGTTGTTWADGIAFYCFSGSSTPICFNGSGSVGPTNNNGYTLVFDDYAQNSASNPIFQYTVALYYGTTLLASQTPSNFQIPLNTWNQVRISFVRNVWKVWMGSTQVINYQDTSRVLTGSGTYNMGFSGHTGGLNAYHWIRNIQVSKHAQGPWRPAAGGNVPGIQYNGPVMLNGNLTVNGTNSLLLTGNGVSMPANNVGDWMVAQYGQGVGDRYGLGQYNNGQLRLFSSAAYSAGSINLSVASQDVTGGAGTFTDILTASNTSVVVRRQMIQSYPTTTRFYQSSSSASTSAGNPIPMTVSMFTGNCPGNYNQTGSLFTTNTTTNPASCNAQCPLITIPYAGIWALVFTMRFNATATENSLWFAPYVSSVWGETSANSNFARCGYTATNALQLTSAFTGYFGTGDTIALCAYSSAANQLVTFNNSNGITMTCINRSA